MQADAFEAALSLILAGPGDQPLMRIMRIAAEVARCPHAVLGVRRPDGYQIIASYGIPLPQYRAVLPRSEAIAQHFGRPALIEDATLAEGFADHPYVVGSPKWRFIGHIPLELPMLPYPVILNVADSRSHIERPHDLLGRLEECAAIAADELQLIGDIALQSELLRSTSHGFALLASAIQSGPLPLALVDDQLIVRAASPNFTQLCTLDHADPVGVPIEVLHRTVSEELGLALRAVLETGAALAGFSFRSYDGAQTLRIDAVRFETPEPIERFLILSLTDRSASVRRGLIATHHLADSPGVVSDFLLSTLIDQKRLLRRGPVPYHALCRWRSSVKDAQIAALKALKRDPGDAFLDAVAEKMASSAGALFGTGTFKAVVPVPCGNSGDNCLSMRLARLIAVRLGVDFIDAFEPQAPTGGSHPKSNLRRLAMRLKTKPKVPVLLVDDVATSGAHIEEAAQILRRTAPAVLPLVWIAD